MAQAEGVSPGRDSVSTTDETGNLLIISLMFAGKQEVTEDAGKHRRDVCSGAPAPAGFASRGIMLGRRWSERFKNWNENKAKAPYYALLISEEVFGQTALRAGL